MYTPGQGRWRRLSSSSSNQKSQSCVSLIKISFVSSNLLQVWFQAWRDRVRAWYIISVLKYVCHNSLCNSRFTDNFTSSLSKKSEKYIQNGTKFDVGFVDPDCRWCLESSPRTRQLRRTISGVFSKYSETRWKWWIPTGWDAITSRWKWDRWWCSIWNDDWCRPTERIRPVRQHSGIPLYIVRVYFKLRVSLLCWQWRFRSARLTVQGSLPPTQEAIESFCQNFDPKAARMTPERGTILLSECHSIWFLTLFVG